MFALYYCKLKNICAALGILEKLSLGKTRRYVAVIIYSLFHFKK
jgi:hypothetical protein